jgi:hypothetical protein
MRASWIKAAEVASAKGRCSDLELMTQRARSSNIAKNPDLFHTS